MVDYLLRVRMLDSGALLFPPCDEDDLPGLIKQCAALTAALQPRLPALFQPQGADLAAALAADLPALEAGPEPAIGSGLSPLELLPAEAREALLKLAPLAVLNNSRKLNNFIDNRASGADDRLQGIIQGFDAEEIKHAQTVRDFSFAGGRLFLTRRDRHQWMEVNRRFKHPTAEVAASLAALNLGALWAGIALLNDHFARLIGIDPDAPLVEGEGEPGPTPTPAPTLEERWDALIARTHANLERLILLANQVRPSDPALAQELLGPWLALQREYAKARRRS